MLARHQEGYTMCETRARQEVLGRTNRTLSFDIKWMAKKKLRESNTQTRRQQGDLISLLPKITGEGYTDKKMIS
jgi:hypothetical protein